MNKLAIESPIFEHKSGLLCDLEAAISAEEVRRLERLGYIENAVSPKGETWRLSKKGRKARKALVGKVSFRDRISDFFLSNVLHYSVSI